jgi:hypothetical protein
MTAIQRVFAIESLFEKIYELSKPVFEDKFKKLIEDVHYDEMYDDAEYISPNMFVLEILQKLKSGAETANAKHGYMYHYGGDGSAWGNAFDLLRDAYRITKPAFEMKFYSTDEPFRWNLEKGAKWLQENCETYYEHMLEIASIDSVEKDFAEDEPDYWGDLEVEIVVKSQKERVEAICWIEEYMAVGHKRMDM